jgi:hypothetical protein
MLTQWVYQGNFLVAGVAFLFGYFGILKDFIPGGVGTAAEIFVGTFVGSWIANQLITPDVKQSSSQIAIIGGIGMIGVFVGLLMAYGLNVSRVMAGSIMGAVFVFLWGSRLAPCAFLGPASAPLSPPANAPIVVGYQTVGNAYGARPAFFNASG